MTDLEMLDAFESKDSKSIDIAQEYLDFLNICPFAVCFISSSTKLSVFWANEECYKIYGCTKEDLKRNYDNKLLCFVDYTSMKITETKKNNEGIEYIVSEMRILKGPNKGNWIYSYTYHANLKGKSGYLWICYDISEYKNLELQFRDYKNTILMLTERTNYEAFEFDISKRVAHIYVSHFILNAIVDEKQESYGGFVETLISKNIVHEDYIERLKKSFAGLEKEKKSFVNEIKMKNDKGNFIWVNISVEIKEKNNNKNRYAAGIIKDINIQKESSIKYLEEIQFFQAMLIPKSAYAQLDIDSDKIMLTGGMWYNYNEVKDKVSYSDIINEFINKVVHPDDREHYLKLMQIANMKESYGCNNTVLSCEFRRIVEQNKMVNMKVTLHLFQDTYSKHLFALLYLEKINKNAIAASINNSEIIQEISDETNPVSVTFENFLSCQGDMAYIVDIYTYELLIGNQAFYDRLGMTEAQCQGKKCYELIFNVNNPCSFCGRANWTTDKFYMWKNKNMHLEQEFLVKNKLVMWEARQVLFTIAVDISNNKSLAAAMDNGIDESHLILGGIEKMAAAEEIEAALNSAFATIGDFFKADKVSFWKNMNSEYIFQCDYAWNRSVDIDEKEIQKNNTNAVNSWLAGETLTHKKLVESREAMLLNSYEMYEAMNNTGTFNQKWVVLKYRDEDVGYLLIENLTRNLQNTSFMESFTGFIVNEIKCRELLEDVVYFNTHDELTNLLNRISYDELLKNFSKESCSCMGILAADINGLKEINSEKGFNMGDYYIKQLGFMLKGVFENYSIFRLNGDEFLVVALDITREQLEAAETELFEWIKINGTFSVSLGIAWDNVEKDLEILIENASQAMKINKKRYYDSEEHTSDATRRRELTELIYSIEERKYEVFLQPKIEFARNIVIGAEALIRYRHEEFGVLTPNKFIDVLEKNNFIRYIDLFVFEEVCRLLEKWGKEGRRLPVISHNFSRLTLMEQNILKTVETIFEKYDISKSNLEIEITESVGDFGKGVLYQVAKNFHNAGYAISLDDFGTKYSNLSIITDIDFSVLKIDRSLISALADDNKNQIILKNIILMCRDLNIEVIAEGVETKDQEEILIDLGCGLGQGYLYGKPMPISEFEKNCLDSSNE